VEELQGHGGTKAHLIKQVSDKVVGIGMEKMKKGQHPESFIKW
jgi:hypothetical protein